MFKKLIVLPVALFAFACAKGDNKNVDSALNSDLTTAAAARPYTALDSVSAAERNAALAGTAPTTVVTKTVPGPVRTRTVYRTAPSRRTSSGGSNTTVYEPAPTHTVQKNTKRDAAIGAAAGAIIGATTSKDKVKGGIIGGAAGAILGGVIGNNVDIKKK
ncbi:MAG: YMGG-like glycine zipper-containing protein [Gemmatimonadota bacterium]|nr:YMGG-like glycine zipper-containing protein [Gemmatimonadota bacterium]